MTDRNMTDRAQRTLDEYMIKNSNELLNAGDPKD
jgi:hypothetical protein